MTDDLKQKFEQLVADPPPPSTLPSQAVFARVRTVRRRRTAGAVVLAAAAVVAVALAITNVTDVNGRPPVSNSPSAPTTIVTPAPTSAVPTTSGTTNSASNAIHTPNTPPPSTRTTGNPPPSSTSSTPVAPPVAPPLGVHVSLKSTVQGRSVTFKVTLSGSMLVPTGENGRPLSTSGIDFVDLLGGTQYFFGDGQQSGSDAGAVNCVSGTQRISKKQTYTLMNDSGLPNASGTHTYAKAGTYTFKYTVNYCSASGWKPVTKTTRVTVR